MEFHLYDKHPLRQQAWSTLCSKHSITIYCYDSLAQLVPKHGQPRLMVFDEATIGDCNGSSESLLAQLPYDVLAFMVPRCTASTISGLIRLGAKWVFDNDANPRELETGLRQLQRDTLDLMQHRQQWEHSRVLLGSLNPGERLVLELVLQGSSNQQIAQRLCVSVRTVESRRAKVYRKCGVTNLIELVRLIEQYDNLQQRFAAGTSPRGPAGPQDQSSINKVFVAR